MCIKTCMDISIMCSKTNKVMSTIYIKTDIYVTKKREACLLTTTARTLKFKIVERKQMKQEQRLQIYKQIATSIKINNNKYKNSHL